MNVAENLTRKLFEDGVVPLEEVQIVKYGLANIGSNLLGVLITLFVGKCFGNIMDSLILWLLVFPLRKNAGGFHAKTQIRCLFISIGLLIVSYICFYTIAWQRYTYILFVVLFGGIIFAMAPMETENKPLDVLENSVYQRRTRAILMLEGVLFLLAIILQWTVLYALITMSFFIVAMALIGGAVKLKIVGKKGMYKL